MKTYLDLQSIKKKVSTISKAYVTAKTKADNINKYFEERFWGTDSFYVSAKSEEGSAHIVINIFNKEGNNIDSYKI